MKPVQWNQVGFLISIKSLFFNFLQLRNGGLTNSLVQRIAIIKSWGDQNMDQDL